MTTFDLEYKKLLFQVYNQGFEEMNQRTGLKTKILLGADLNLDMKNFPLLTLRKIPTQLFVAEQIWYLQGEKDLVFFQNFSKAWNMFAEDDNTVDSSYGYRWRNFFHRDQVQSLINMFEKDPSSRQGVVVTWDPNTDGLDGEAKKNVPCVPIWIANVVNGKLNFHVIFRSNDIILGLPHDVAGFALLLNILAQRLNLEPGHLHYSISHLHIYENQYKHCEEILARFNPHTEIKLNLPENTFQRAMDKDLSVVTEIISNFDYQYNPLGSLGKIPIAL